MDIKNVMRTILPFPSQPTAPKAESKTVETGDRDANGQSSGEQREHRHLTEAEVKDVSQYLESLPGIKENGLTVRLEVTDGIRVIYILDHSGKVVRRLAESDLILVLNHKDRKSGNILNRAM